MTSTPRDPGIDQLRRGLLRTRALVRSALVARHAAVVIAALLGLVLAVIATDYVLRLPGLFRLLMLGGVVAAVIVLVRGRLVPALAFAPSLTDIALRLERQGAFPASLPPLRDLLASGLELGDVGGEGDPRLRADVAKRAADAFRIEHWKRVVRRGPLLRALAIALAAVAVCAGIAAVRPTHAAIGLTRLALPFGDTRWPARTDIESATAPGVRPADEAVELLATLVRSARDPMTTRVEAVYRVESADGERTRERRELMSPQAAAVDGGGVRFASILEPALLVSPGTSAAEGRAADRWLVVRYETDDDRTAEQRILLSPPPRIVGASVDLALPSYVPGDAPQRRAAASVAEDARVTVGPVLSGTRVELTLTFNKPVELATELEAGGPVIAASGNTVTLRVRAEDPVTARIGVVDRNGLVPRDDTVVVIGVVPDRPPSAAVLEPRSDQDVLPTARVVIEAEARDDIAVSDFGLEQRTVSANAPDPRRTPGGGEAGRERLLRTDLPLAPLGLEPGDEVKLVALARDGYFTSDGPREETRSSERTLRIISQEQLVEQVRGRLAVIEQAARELDRRQADQSRALRSGEPRASVAQSQRGLASQIEQQREAVEQLNDRVERNALDDAALSALLNDAEALAAEAARAAEAASDNITQSTEAGDRAEQQAAREQQRARDALGRLLERLDSGEDSFLARRGLERLLEQQRALAEQTASAGQDALGLSPEELSAEQSETLAEIAAQQKALADAAQRAADELSNQASQMRERDPTEAGALEQAASEARRRDIAGKLEQAAGQIGENQTGEAGQQQQEAIDALEDILEQLDKAEENRDAALRRELASLIDTLRSLVARQTAEIDRLVRVRGGAEAGEPSLDRAMIVLHTRTLDAADRAATGFAELAILAGMIADAAVNQDDAITLIRAGDENYEAAELAERDALALLEQALAEAERVDEQAEQRERDRLQAELRAKYAAALERQVALGERITPLVHADRGPTRQERAEARRIARDQSSLAEDVAAIYDSQPELAESPMVGVINTEIARAMAGVAEDLGGGNASGTAIVLHDRAAELLRSLVEAFTPYTPPNDENFGEDGGGGGGGEGGQGDQELIAAIAELRMMRGLQQQLLGLTKALDNSGSDRVGPYDREGLAEMQRGLAEQGQRVIEKLSGAQPQPAPPAGEPVDTNNDEPGDDPVEF